MTGNRFILCLIAISLAAAALLASPASAVWQDDGNPTCSAANCQANARLISDGMGGAFICWDDKRAGLTEDLYAQHLTPDGVPSWQSQGVLFCAAANSQYWPRMTRDGSGGIIAVWQDFRNGGHTNLFARRIDASGTPLWTTNGVAICMSADEQQYTRIISDGAGGAIISWQDCRTGLDNDIYAQRISPSGSIRWTLNGVQVSQVSYSEQEKPGMVPDGLGGAIIVWQDMRNGTYDIYAQRVDASGTVLWAVNGIPVCQADGDQMYVRAVPDGAGGAIVAWEDWRSGAPELYLQHVDILGATAWGADGVKATTSESRKTLADLASDGIGGAVVVWQDLQEGGDHNVVAQRVNASGARQWGDSGVTVCGCAGYQFSPCVVSDLAGGAIIAWEDRRVEFAGDLYAQRVSAAGSVLWSPDGIPVCDRPGTQTGMELISDGLGGAIMAWTDAANYMNTDVYAQRIDGDGNVVGIATEPRPQASLLEQNFPNPFNPATVIRFAMSEPGSVKLVVYDVSGRQVRILLDGAKPAGRHEVAWDGRDERGAAAASGVYLYSLETAGYNENRKMVLLR